MRSWAKRFGAEQLSPGRLHLGDGVADHLDRGAAARGEGDAFGAEVVGVGLALEVVAALELTQKVVERLLADPQAGGQLGGPRALRPRVLEDGQVGGVEVVEAALVQALEHVPLYRFPGDAQERADQRRPERPCVGSDCVKGLDEPGRSSIVKRLYHLREEQR